jgi:hypothetical protein
MPTWAELERRFHELQPQLQGARLDRQRDDYGERWHIAASNALAKAKFEALSAMAGAKLTQLSSTAQFTPEIVSAPDHAMQWYRLLASRYYRDDLFYEYTDAEGKPTDRWGTLGSIDDPAAVAAYHCLQLSPADDDLPKGNRIVMTNILSGPNSRVNVQSVDNSTNTVTVGASPEILVDLIAAIRNANLPVEESKALEQTVIDMRDALGMPTFGERYTSFMSFLADHMQVWPTVAPYLASLAALATQALK